MQTSVHAPGEASTSGAELRERLEEGLRIAGLLRRNTEEMSGVLRALNGEYILPEAGGDLLRDGAGVLPTGTELLYFFFCHHCACPFGSVNTLLHLSGSVHCSSSKCSSKRMRT